jgi:hypothetical protein
VPDARLAFCRLAVGEVQNREDDENDDEKGRHGFNSG